MDQWYLYLLIYNFCAFALQMPIGMIADRWNKNPLCAAVGCGLVASAYGLGYLNPFTAVLAAGIGNGLFHIGGGIDILKICKEKASLLGLFVSPGAMGIYLGTIAGRQDKLPDMFIVTVLLTVAVLILTAGNRRGLSLSPGNKPASFHNLSAPSVLIAVSCLLAVVCLRSYIGMASGFPWKSQKAWGIILVFALVLGKTAGGFLADKLGAVKASILSLGAASVFYLFSGHALFGVLAVFFFNMTMPITLWALAGILKENRGFAFGLLTFGLFIGFLPAYFMVSPLVLAPAAYTAAALVSLALLYSGLRKAVK
jgi:FSR family fosmidomycin resistance protein-like MFS transporter